MKKRILLKGRIIAIPAALILILLILVQSQGADGMVVLTDEQASSVTGSCSKVWCVIEGDGCWAQVSDCPLGTAGAGRPCRTPCANPWQNWECDYSFWYLKHGGCTPNPNKDCGIRSTGICNGIDTACQTNNTEDCGEATDCDDY